MPGPVASLVSSSPAHGPGPVVDEDVEPAERRHGRRNRVLDACGGGQISNRCLNGVGAGERDDFLRGSRELLRATGRQHHARAFRGERLRAGQAEPAARPGDQRHLVLKTEIHATDECSSGPRGRERAEPGQHRRVEGVRRL